MNQPFPPYPKEADSPGSQLPFSPCVVFGDLIFVSGQALVDATGIIIDDTFEGEYCRSLENLRKVLEAAGRDLTRVIHTRNDLRAEQDLPRCNGLYREYFQCPFPERMTLVNCLGAALRFEIEAVAERKP